MKQKSNSTIVLRVIFFVGMVLLFVIFLNRKFTLTIFNLSQPSQSIYALATALICFFTSYIGNRSDYKKDIRLAGMISLLPWCGLIAIGMAIFLASVNFDTRTARLGILINYYLSILGFFYAYLIIFTFLYPQVIRDEPTPPPDPLSGLPKNLREILHEGRTSVDMAAVRTVAIYLVIVIVSNIFLIGSINLLKVIIVEFCVALPLALMVRYFAARKWQDKARQLGIPERKLKSAAKLASLPWPKIKEE